MTRSHSTNGFTAAALAVIATLVLAGCGSSEPASAADLSGYEDSASSTLEDARSQIEMVEGLAAVYGSDKASLYTALSDVAEKVDVIKSNWRTVDAPDGDSRASYDEIATGLYVQAKAMDKVLESVDTDSVASATEGSGELSEASGYFDRAESMLGDL